MRGGSPASSAPVEQVVGLGVLVRRHARRQALVHRPGGQPVQLDPAHLEQGDPPVGGDPEHLAQPAVALGALGDVHRGHRHLGPQQLDDRVAARHPLRVAGRTCRAPARTALVGALGPLVGDVALAVLRLRRRALALEPTLDATAGPGGRVALAGALDRAAARGVPGHQRLPPTSLSERLRPGRSTV